MSETPAATAADPVAPDPGFDRRFVRFVSLLFFYAIAGPPIGSVIFFTLIAVSKIQSLEDAGYALLSPFVGLLFAPFSYIFGAVPAAIGGILVAGWQAFRGPVSAVSIVILGCVLGLGLAAVTQGVLDPSDKRAVDWPDAATMFLTAALPTVISWYPMRKRFYPRAGSAERGA